MRLIISPYYQHHTVIHVLPVLLNVQTHAFESIDLHHYNTKYGCQLHEINERSFCLSACNYTGCFSLFLMQVPILMVWGEGWGCILSDMVQLRLAEIKCIPLLGQSPFPQHYSSVRLPAWWSDRLNSIPTMA